MSIQDLPKPSSHLSGRHRHTYESIFHHPVAHNLEWHDVISLLNEIARVSEDHNGVFQVTSNGQMLSLQAPKHKDAPIDMVLEIRHFLERSEASKLAQIEPGVLLLVVIDHHEAKVFRAELHGTVPQQIIPYDPHGYLCHLVSKNEHTEGKRSPEQKSFYEAIAATLRGADKILIFGHGTGESNAMEQLVAELKRNHADVADHIIGSIVVDWRHLSEDQLLAKARHFFGSTGDESDHV